MHLRELQTRFCQQVLFGEQTGVDSLVHPGEFTSERRLQIYGNNIRSTLTESLQSIYSATEAIVGRDYFKMLARQYLVDFPPEQGSIHQFGDQFAQFVKTFEGLEKIAYLTDIASIDWAYHTAFHAPSAPSVSVSCLARFTPDDYENLLLHRHPSVTVVSSSFPIFDIWNYAQNESEDISVPDINAAAQNVLIVRNDLTVEVINLDKELSVLLDMCSENRTLGFMLGCVIDSNSTYNLEVGLHTLFSTGAVHDVSIAN
ncbi:MAG: DNA-binding domain-containing protein [Acidiferrobacterales bacterium]|nr:DNA-binding domain-containing protein [Acidiferrobacterales bacterium]